MARDLGTIVFLIGLLLLAPLGATSPYFVITPGGTYDIGSRIRVPDEQRKASGRLAFTAVYQQEANWGEVARVRVVGQAEIVPAEQVRPRGVTQQQVNETNRRLIDESKPVAAVVGLRAAGYDVEITGKGAQVESVLDGMPAAGILHKGDIIVAVDGQPALTTNALIEAVRRHEVGDTVTLTVQREGATEDVSVGTRPSPSEPERPVVGITISTFEYDVRLPFPVDIESDNVGGPSAGFMFALGILDAVTDGDLTRGHYVAGTGTLSADGTVGPIGGAAEKALAAEKDGAQLFLVPRANEHDARRWVQSIRVVPIERFEEGISALCGLEPRTPEAAEVVPPPCRPGSA